MPDPIPVPSLAVAGRRGHTFRRLTERPEMRNAVMVVSVVLAVITSTWWAIRNGMLNHGSLDLRVYVGAVHSWLHGDTALYDYAIPAHDGPLRFAYPPFAAVVLSPLTTTSYTTTVAIFAELSLLALGASTWWAVLPLVRRHNWNAMYVWALAVPIAFAIKPSWLTVGIGQINLILLVLILTDFILLHRKSNYAGIGIGLAAAIKLTPLLFIGYLMVTRRWRSSIIAAATAAGATLLGAIALPSASWRYFTDFMFDVESISNAARSPDQSIGAFLARITGETTPPTQPWLALVVPVAVFGLWRAYRAYGHGADLAGFTIVGLTTALVSPISWTHHLVWIIPALVVLVSASVEGSGTRRYLWGAVALGTFALFASQITMRYGDLASPSQLDQVGVLVIVDAYLIAILLLVAFLPFPADKKIETSMPAMSRDR